MVSNIDPTLPLDGVPAVKSDLRNNLQTAKDEIEALQGRTVNILDEGGSGDGTTDNVAAIRAAVGDGVTAALNDATNVFFPKGNYFIGSSGDVALASKPLRLFGEEGTELWFENFSFTVRSPEMIPARDGALTADASRGDTILTVNTQVSSVAQVGDIAVITNTVAADTQFNYPTAHTSIVVEVDGSTIRIMHPLNFDFNVADAGNQVQLRRQGGFFTMENLAIRNKELTTGVQCFKIAGLKSPLLRNIQFLSDGPAFKDVSNPGHSSDHMPVSDCVGFVMKDTRIIDAYIGVQLAQCRDSLIDTMYSQSTHHPVVPASWSDNTIVKSMESVNDQGGVESHPCFNVHFIDCQTNDSVVSNLRSVGGSIINTVIRTDPSRNPSSLFQTVRLVDEDAYNGHDFIIRDSDIDIINPFIVTRNNGKCIIENSTFSNNLQFGDGSPGQSVTNPIVRNVDTPSLVFTSVVGGLDAGNRKADATLNTGVYEIDVRPINGQAFDCNPDHISVYGKVFRQETTNPTAISLRIYDIWFGDVNTAIKGLIKLKASAEFGTAAFFDGLENHYHFRHNAISSSTADIFTTPAFTSDPSGEANESLTITVSNPTFGNGGTTDAFIQFDVSLGLNPLANPRFSLVYELEMWK